MVRRLSPLILMLALLPSCSILDPDDGERDRLADARARWAAQGADDYTFRLQRGSCECLPEWMHPLRIRVMDGVVAEVTDLTAGTTMVADERARTVAELFALVEDLLDRGASQLSVVYHASLGYPTSIAWDVDRAIADDEGRYDATDLLPLR